MARPPHLLIVEARYYAHVSDHLLNGATAALAKAGVSHERIAVPGAFEIPGAISFAEASGKFDGYVALGCVIRGETSHYDHVCGECARGIQELALDGLAIGFGVLFSFVGTFNYIAFYLAGPPFGLSAAAIGTIFVVWLIGVVTTPATGFFVRRIGRRALVLIGMVFWAAGLLVTLSSNLALIVAGLALAAGCGFFCQAASTAYVAVSAERARSSAVGLYVTFYYLGGSVGAVLPGYAWNRFGWPGCVAVLVAMVGIMGVMVARFWRESHRLSGKPGVAA